MNFIKRQVNTVYVNASELPIALGDAICLWDMTCALEVGYFRRTYGEYFTDEVKAMLDGVDLIFIADC